MNAESLRRSSLVFFLCVALFLTACSGGSQTVYRPLYSGSDGLLISFPTSNSLRQFAGEAFSLSLRMENDGASNISNGYLTAIYDTSVLDFKRASISGDLGGSTIKPQTQSASLPSSVPTTIGGAVNAALQSQSGSSTSPAQPRGAFSLRGRTQYDNFGDVAYAEFTFTAKNLTESRGIASTPITFQACYPYTTVFVGTVCVDRDQNSATTQARACAAQTITAQPEGAPVSVQQIVPRYVRGDSGVTPRYEITLQNLRSGIILWQGGTEEYIGGPIDGMVSFPASSAEVCDLQNLQHSEYGVAYVAAQVGGAKLSCGTKSGTPAVGNGIARFNHNTATIVCSLDGKPGDAFTYGGNYLAPLVIQVRYFYIQSISAKLEVVR